MKTDQVERVRKTDDRGDRGLRETPRPSVPPQRSSTGGALRRVTVGVVAVLLIAAIAAGAWFAMTPTVEEPSFEAAPLFELSLRAREHAPAAAIGPQGGLLDSSIRAREPVATVPPQVSTYYRSVRARDHAAVTPSGDSLLQQSIRARER